MAERRITGAVNDPGRGATQQATQAAIEAETNENTYLPPDLIRHNPGVAKVWVKFDITGSIDGSFNVDSITDTGAGNWTVVITTDFSDINYSALATWHDQAVTETKDKTIQTGTAAVGSFTVQLFDISEVVLVDAAATDALMVVAFGDQ